MIKQTFLFLDNVSRKKEKIILSQAKDWNEFLQSEKIKGVSKEKKKSYDTSLRKAKANLMEENSSYFAKRIPSAEMWRLYSFFKEDAVFLDIEATGVSAKDRVNIIGLYNGTDTKIMVRGINLDINALAKELQNYKIIVTFNGGSFDLPFLEKRYPGLLPNIPHVDIKVACKRMGLEGGLKNIEKKLGIRRESCVERFYGGDPALLYRMFMGSGDKYYLDLLIKYNEEDIINLKRVADKVIDELEYEYT